MLAPESVVALAGLLALLIGLLAASVSDLRTREIDDRLWQGLGAVGVALGAAVALSESPTAFLLWLLVGAFALQHLFPWDDALGRRGERWILPIEATVYLGVIVVIATTAVRLGVGPEGLSLPVLAAFASVLLARGLFELGVLYGGADAKAVIVAGLLVPTLATPLLLAPSLLEPVSAFLPFSITLLTNAALFSVAVPLALAVRNVRRGEFDLRRGFTGYSLAVMDLPSSYVWVRDPRVDQDGFADDVDTSEEDRRRREELAKNLTQRGIDRVWVSPQIPFIVLMAVGAVLGALVGNVLLDLFVWLG